MELTKVQRNEIFRAVEAGGLDPRECNWVISEEHEALIMHRPTGASLSVSRMPLARSLGVTTAPGPDDRFNTAYRVESASVPVKHNSYRWRDVPGLVTMWAKGVVDNESLPDLWDEMCGVEVLEAVEAGLLNNQPFSPAEQQQISMRIEEAKILIGETYELQPEQLSSIERRLDDLKEASERVGRKDWLMMLYGAAFGLIVNDSVPPVTVQSVISAVIHGVGHIFGVGGPLPSLGW